MSGDDGSLAETAALARRHHAVGFVGVGAAAEVPFDGVASPLVGARAGLLERTGLGLREGLFERAGLLERLSEAMAEAVARAPG